MFAIFILISALNVFAQEIHENYNGARSLAMGGASIAVVNDETALLTNPAALGKLRDYYGTIFDPEVELGQALGPMYQKKAFTQPFDLEQVKATTDQSRDTYYHAKAQLFPSFVMKNFGIGIHAVRELDAKMDPTGAKLTTFYRDDIAMHVGFNLRFFDGRIKIGAAGKLISRIEINNKDLDAALPLALDAGYAAEGVGAGFDGGIILTAPWTLLPTLSVVARDVGGTNYSATSGLRLTTVDRPDTTPQDIDAAIAIFPIHSPKSRSSFTLQMDKIKEAATSTDKNRYYHVGYEFNYSDVLFLRAGMNQRYWTAGFEIATESLQWQLSSYGEDVGAEGNPVEDRRYLFKFAYRF